MERRKHYGREERLRIVGMVENLKNAQDYNAIFEILTDDPQCNYTQNANGVFLNLSNISDATLDKVVRYLERVHKKHKPETFDNPKFLHHLVQEERTYRLRNYEKNLLKQRRIKKILDQDEDYHEIQI
jgi:hypothetical protein